MLQVIYPLIHDKLKLCKNLQYLLIMFLRKKCNSVLKKCCYILALQHKRAHKNKSQWSSNMWYWHRSTIFASVYKVMIYTISTRMSCGTELSASTAELKPSDQPTKRKRLKFNTSWKYSSTIERKTWNNLEVNLRTLETSSFPLASAAQNSSFIWTAVAPAEIFGCLCDMNFIWKRWTSAMSIFLEDWVFVQRLTLIIQNGGSIRTRMNLGIFWENQNKLWSW